MRKSIVRITTADTGKTYEFPGEDNPELWEVKLSIERVDARGCVSYSAHKYPAKTIYLERQTIINAGLQKRRPKEDPPAETEETAEDLLLRLLEHVGYYPSE